MGKQLKISELKRVVNVDLLSKYANILSDENNKDEKQIESILSELFTKTPSRDVLIKTRLGFILKDLSNRRNLSPTLRQKAVDLRAKWKDFHKRLLLAPKFDVKCDKPTTERRQKARNSLHIAFEKSIQRDLKTSSHDVTNIFKEENQTQEQIHLLVGDLEFEIFKYCETLVNTKYLNSVNKCIKIINENYDLRNKFLNCEISSTQFVQNCLN
jgi:hypothetical protein